MRNILLTILTLFSLQAFSQVIPKEIQDAWDALDGQRTVLRNSGYYKNDTAPNGLTRLNYYRDVNIFADGDSVNITFELTDGHAVVDVMRVLKTPKGATLNNKYSTVTRDFFIPTINHSHGFSMIDDTIVGFKYADNYLTDTVLYLDRNYNRLLAVALDQASIGISDTTLFISQIIVHDSGWFATGYYRPSDDLKTGIVMRSRNRGRTWDTVKTFPTTTFFLPEEPSLVLGNGDSLIWFCRSDFGTRTWVSRSADGTTWSAPVIAFQGANQPRAIAIDSLIICYGRPVGYASSGQEIEYFADTVRPQGKIDYNTYTNMGVSWDNGQTWYTYFVDKQRSESFDWPGVSSETGHFYRVGGDTVRFVWSSGNEGLGAWDEWGDLNQATFFINRYQPGDVRFIGGISGSVPYYNTFINSDSLNIVDTLNGKRASITVDNNTVNFVTNSNEYNFDTAVRVSGTVGVNTTVGSGRTIDIISLQGTERWQFGDGNTEIFRIGNGSAIRGRQANGTLAAPTATTIGQELQGYSSGGYESGYITNWGVTPFAAENFTSSTTRGVELWFQKYNSGSANYDLYNFVDSIGRTWCGTSSTQPVLTATFNVGGSLSVDSSMYAGKIDLAARTATTINVTEGDYMILVDATAGNVTVNLPPAAANLRREITVMKVDASGNTVTIDADAGELINGATTLVITTQWVSQTAKCNATAWFTK